MNNLKPIYLIMFFALSFIACGEDTAVLTEPAYEVNVAIISPDNGTAFAAGESFTVEVDYERNNNIIHNIKVEILDETGNSVKKLVERHAHVPNSFTYKEEDIIMNQAGTYIIRAQTTDLDLDGDGQGVSNEDADLNNMVEHTIIIQ